VPSRELHYRDYLIALTFTFIVGGCELFQFMSGYDRIAESSIVMEADSRH